jgi:phage terminase small subunit
MRHKQQRFAIEYCVDFNATQAATRAGYSPNSAHDTGWDLLQNAEVIKMIEDRKADLAAAAGITPDWILRKWREIVEEDPNDLMETRNKPCSQCWPSGLEYDEPNPGCALCMGQGQVVTIFKNSRGRKLFAGVKKTKDGLEIKTRDQDAALKNLSAYLGMSVERRELSGPGGKPISLANLTADDLSDDELAAIAAGHGSNIPASIPAANTSQ